MAEDLTPEQRKGGYKLDAATVLRIYHEPEARGLAAKYGVNKTTIQDIRRGKAWRSITGAEPTKAAPVTDDLPAYLSRRVEFEPNSGCWLWARNIDEKGYGRIEIKSPTPAVPRGIYPAHRLSWIAHRGPIPDGLWVLHRCDTPSCVNPDHLFFGTAIDNMRDMVRKGRAKAPGAPYSRVRPDAAEQIRAALREGRSVRQTARDFGVSGTTVRYHRERV